jgi:transposase
MGPLKGWDNPKTQKGGRPMVDRSISRRYRWKVQGHLAVLEYAAVHGVQPAAVRFGLDRKTVRQWRDRAREAGAPGLVPRYPKRRPRRIPVDVVELIAHARREFG